MGTMVSEVYDALKEAGVGEEKARAAAEAIAGYENRFAKINQDMAVIRGVIGLNLVFTSVILWKVFSTS